MYTCKNLKQVHTNPVSIAAKSSQKASNCNPSISLENYLVKVWVPITTNLSYIHTYSLNEADIMTSKDPNSYNMELTKEDNFILHIENHDIVPSYAIGRTRAQH